MGEQLLIANPGSSSLKLRILGPDDEVVAAADGPAPDDRVGEVVRAFLSDLSDQGEVAAAAVRVVHGGARFDGPLLVDDGVEHELVALDELAPLHNPPARALIAGLRAALDGRPVVACFDTAFHRTLPAAAATYAVPWSWTSELGLRRYGFHGLSHQWAATRVAELLGGPSDDRRVVTAHLGAGASLAAVRGGRSVDTTMGFTPIEGLVMATRSGSVDPGALLRVQRRLGLGADEVEHALEHESGLLGLSGRSADLRELLALADGQDPRARLALDVYLHRLRAGIAQMAAALGGLDVLVFTGGVGEHSPRVRAEAVGGLPFLGLALDREANEQALGGDADIGARGATTCLVVESREDRQMAAEARRVLGARAGGHGTG